MKSILANTKSRRQVSIFCAVACDAFLRRSSFPLSDRRRERLPDFRYLIPRGQALRHSATGCRALVNAAEKFDVVALTEIFGPDRDDVVFSGEFAQDRKRAADFAVEAREKTRFPWTERAGIAHSC